MMDLSLILSIITFFGGKLPAFTVNFPAGVVYIPPI